MAPRPADLGIHNGQLAPCPPNRPGCVCSQHAAEGRDPGPHHIAPFRFEGDPGDAMTRIVAVLLQQPDCEIVSSRPDYLRAEFKSARLGLVDDVEFLLAPHAGVIHVRGSSRLAIADLGLNRARLERLREAFDEADD